MHEIKQVRHMHETFAAIIEAMGGTVLGLAQSGARIERNLGGRNHHSRTRNDPHG